MKTFCLTTMIAVFLLLCSNGIQAQTTQTKLNQVELLKQFSGSWKCDIAKDTTAFWDARSYGTGLECNYKTVTKGKVVIEAKELYGYDRSSDKCICAGLIRGKDIAIYSFWFTSKDKYIELPYSDISNPEKASFKVDGKVVSPDKLVETIFVNHKPIRIDTWTRIK
jgi:hypothetical protein